MIKLYQFNVMANKIIVLNRFFADTRLEGCK